jgi:sugar phosphate isomerase/epimerase
MVCLEMHPGVTIFSVAGFEALADYLGTNVGINFDPSHFWWHPEPSLWVRRGHRPSPQW